MGVVDEATQDGVAHRGIAYQVVPVIHRQLARYYGGSQPVPVFDHLEHVPVLLMPALFFSKLSHLQTVSGHFVHTTGKGVCMTPLPSSVSRVFPLPQVCAHHCGRIGAYASFSRPGVLPPKHSPLRGPQPGLFVRNTHSEFARHRVEILHDKEGRVSIRMLKRLAQGLFRGGTTKGKGPIKRGRHNGLPADNWDISQREKAIREIQLTSSLEINLERIKEITNDSLDVGVRRFKIGIDYADGAVVYIDGMVDSRAVEELIENLTIEVFKVRANLTEKRAIYDMAKETLIPQKDVREVHDFTGLWDGVAAGGTALLIDGVNRALTVETRGWNTRAVEEPDSETSLRGPREGFVESLRTNTSLIRRRIRTAHLRIKSLTIGSLTKTEVAYAYIKGLASDQLVEEVYFRLQKIDIDGVLESGYLEEYIEDTPLTLFPLTERTEKPDRVAAALLEGRVAIFTDGTPFALIVPTGLNALLQAPDDYYERLPIGSFLRALRFFAFAVSLILPGSYVAVVNFHHELLPTVLFMRISAAREGVPFPTAFEVMLMELLFELLREAGVRLPRAIGPAISIVGALILGDASIRAGIVSPVVVIIVALTAIASFSTPVFSLAVAARLLRFLFVALGATLGLFGIQFGLLILLTHLSSLRSFGQPYLAPFAPLIPRDLKDTLVRVWWWDMVTRPRLEGFREPKRQDRGQCPRPGED